MANSPIKNLARILSVEETLLLELDAKMVAALGRKGVLDVVYESNRKSVEETLKKIDSGNGGAYHILSVLRKTIFADERRLFKHLDKMPGNNDFDKTVRLAKEMAGVRTGFFLKKENIEKILRLRKPAHLLEFLGYKDVDTLLAKEDWTECFSALRFVESNDWMHDTFKEVYSHFGPADFEEREVDVRVLGPQWKAIAEKFVAKKHHNVSHLKEFGVIFLNPIEMDIPGKFLRDFALLLHYFHEIQFYSRLFKESINLPNFSEKFQSLLRGDVREVSEAKLGEWLIVQRYLTKENPNDPRLFMPRVNPESMHWSRGELDFANYFKKTEFSDISLWGDLDWVGDFFTVDNSPTDELLISFDLEDNAMSVVSFLEGRQEFFTYHQREAMWTKIFAEYVGGEDKMEELIIKNFDSGIIKFG